MITVIEKAHELSLNHPSLSCNTGLQLRQHTFSHNELVTLLLTLAMQKVLFYRLLCSSELNTGRISLSSPVSRLRRRGSGRKQTEQML